jgi:hypothetical protein
MMSLTRRSIGRSRLLPACLALLVALLVLAGWLRPGGPAPAHAEGEEWSKVTILYHADVKGHIEPCG